MQIQINTDHNIQGREALASRMTGVVEHALRRVADRVTRVEMHLSIESGGRGGQSDKRCTLEARLEGLDSVAVTEHSGTLDQAATAAADKLLRAIDARISKQRDKSYRAAAAPQATEADDADGGDES